MRAVLFAYFVTGIFLKSYLFWGSANGQYFEDPTRYFKKFEFDMMNRGSFNISNCLKDLMTCFELVKPDVICAWDKLHDTVCSTTRMVCHDYYGDLDTYGFRFITSESMCKSDSEQAWT